MHVRCCHCIVTGSSSEFGGLPISELGVIIQHQKVKLFFHSGGCTLPFYESTGVCVETCPTDEFGNHTSGQCEPCKYGFSDCLAVFYTSHTVTFSSQSDHHF